MKSLFVAGGAFVAGDFSVARMASPQNGGSNG
jgi:hypothetical protein